MTGAPPSAREQRGFILVTAVIFVLILSVLGASLMSYAPLEEALVIDAAHRGQAFWYAEAGVTRGLQVLRLGTLSSVSATRPTSLDTSVVPIIRAMQQRADGTWDSTGDLLLRGANAGPVRILATGRSAAVNGFMSEARTVQMMFLPDSLLPVDPQNLLTATGSIHLSKNDVLVGRIRVPTPADSFYLVDYVNHPFGSPISPDSVSVHPPVMPNFRGFIDRKIAGDYNTITSSQIQASKASAPLVLGPGGAGNGIYYASGGLSANSGAAAAITVYGLVYILVDGQTNIGKDLAIQAGDANAALVIIDLVGTNGSASGFTLNKVTNSNSIPMVMMTNGDVNFKTAGNLGNVSIFGHDIYFADNQYYAYNHAVMDNFLSALMDAADLPLDVPTAPISLHQLSGSWSELAQPLLH